jgi:hypothetical protein
MNARCSLSQQQGINDQDVEVSRHGDLHAFADRQFADSIIWTARAKTRRVSAFAPKSAIPGLRDSALHGENLRGL